MKDTRDDGVDRQATLAIGLIVLGIGLLVNSVAGPLLTDSIDYPFSDSMRSQTIGLDAVALLLIAPACFAVGVLAWRGHRLAPVLTLSLGSYVAYIFLQYLVGPEFDYYPATLLLHLGLFVAGWMLTAHAWTLSHRSFDWAARLSSRHATAAVVMAGFVVLRYVPGLVGSLSQDPLPDEVSGDITMYWLIVLADLGVFVPIVIVTAIGVSRRATWARLAMTATVGWFTVVSVAVGAMSLTMILNDDRYASTALLGLFVVTAAVAAGYSIHLHRGLLTPPPPDTGSGNVRALIGSER